MNVPYMNGEQHTLGWLWRILCVWFVSLVLPNRQKLRRRTAIMWSLVDGHDHYARVRQLVAACKSVRSQTSTSTSTATAIRCSLIMGSLDRFNCTFLLLQIAEAMYVDMEVESSKSSALWICEIYSAKDTKPHTSDPCINTHWDGIVIYVIRTTTTFTRQTHTQLYLCILYNLAKMLFFNFKLLRWDCEWKIERVRDGKRERARYAGNLFIHSSSVSTFENTDIVK